eukprot:GEMP01017846.1.p1 GENE.GEMP01017846.1~~GEMP01017846.1.p1  ORF type:complete len:426 (+),score=74.97 GEMP01017846.1:85-1278(+)
MGAAKKNDPSKVVHFRNIPESVQESQVLGLCEPFGQVTHVLFNQDKRRALVEFQSVRMAIQCYSFFERVPCVVDGTQLNIGFSSKRDIGKGNPANRVLEVTITNMKYPVPVEILAQIFKPFVVRKIAYTESNEESISALVELDDVDSATGAFYKLQNKNIYADCNTVRVKYSKLKEVGSSETDVSVVEKPDFSISTKRVALTHPVCILHGLHEQLAKPDEIARVFQAYGQVVRVKIMYNNRAICLVQMGTIEECQEAIRHLNGFVLHGRRMNVEPSKGKPIPMPTLQNNNFNPADQERLTVDFTGALGRAFTGPDSRRQLDDTCAVKPPSETLRVVEPVDAENCTGEILKTLLRAGMKVNVMKYPEIEFCHVDEAIHALATCHTTPLSTGPLHLTFA